MGLLEIVTLLYFWREADDVPLTPTDDGMTDVVQHDLSEPLLISSASPYPNDIHVGRSYSKDPGQSLKSTRDSFFARLFSVSKMERGCKRVKSDG